MNKLDGNDKTRDILYVKGSFKNEKLHIFVNHWPSNYGGKEKSIPKRKATAELIIQEFKKITDLEKWSSIMKGSASKSLPFLGLR